MGYDSGIDMHMIFGVAMSLEFEIIWEGTKNKPYNVC